MVRLLLANGAKSLISWCPGEGTVFFRIKQSGPRSYLQIVENQREGGAVRQKVIATLGRTDELAARAAWLPCWPPGRATASRFCCSPPSRPTLRARACW